MIEDCSRMLDLNNWEEITNGLYKYPVSEDLNIEIHVVFHNKNTDILTSKSRIYLVGEHGGPGAADFFEREFLMVGPLMACLEKARLYTENILQKGE